MADINLKPLFQFPDTVSTLISLMEVTIKSLKTGQVEPYRHFLEVRLQEKEDRNHLIVLLTKWINLMRMGLGHTEMRKEDMFGSMPVGYVPSKFKGKVVLHKVIEPSKAFTDKKRTPLKLQPVTSKVRTVKGSRELSLEDFSISSQRSKELGLNMGMSRILLRAAMEELALSDDWQSELGHTGLSYVSEDGKKDPVGFFDLLQGIETIVDPYEIEGPGEVFHVAVESQGNLPVFLGLLVKTLPKLIKRLEESNLGEKYPKLLKALKAVQSVVETIQSEK